MDGMASIRRSSDPLLSPLPPGAENKLSDVATEMNEHDHGATVRMSGMQWNAVLNCLTDCLRGVVSGGKSGCTKRLNV